jgi:hypothetical protein
MTSYDINYNDISLNIRFFSATLSHDDKQLLLHLF